MIKGVYIIPGLLVLIASCTTGKNKFEQKADEPVFVAVDSTDSEYKKTVEVAQDQLSYFEKQLKTKSASSAACVKVYVPDDKGDGGFLWLIDPVFKSDTCTAAIFEVPAEFSYLKPGDKLKFSRSDIQDWYILDVKGRIQGGYSLRYQRRKLSTKDQIAFDEYIGVKEYL